VIVNTGDDFEHLGLAISPDVDTSLYTLAGVANPETGWGRRDETWSFMHAIAELGGPTWFKLGDRDLATHVERTRRLRAGETLTAVTAHLARRLGVTAHVLPMTDDPVRTLVERCRDARVPGLFRAPAVPAGRAQPALRGRRRGAHDHGGRGRAVGGDARRHRRLASLRGSASIPSSPSRACARRSGQAASPSSPSPPSSPARP
jgi:hypothetical protein